MLKLKGAVRAHHRAGSTVGDRSEHGREQGRLHRAVLHVDEEPWGRTAGKLVCGCPQTLIQWEQGGRACSRTVVARVGHLLRNRRAVAVDEDTKFVVARAQLRLELGAANTCAEYACR